MMLCGAGIYGFVYQLREQGDMGLTFSAFCDVRDGPEFLLNKHGAVKQTIRDSGAKVGISHTIQDDVKGPLLCE
eukprot:SAG31_NODE_836_length_11643_cov_3.389813_2_plen_74_part_00